MIEYIITQKKNNILLELILMEPKKSIFDLKYGASGKFKLFENKGARKVMVAQSAEESSFGSSTMAISKKNLFGMGGFTYSTLKDSVDGYGWQLGESSIAAYKNARNHLKANPTNRKGYLDKFADTYCTSPSGYVGKINTMIEQLKNWGIW